MRTTPGAKGWRQETGARLAQTFLESLAEERLAEERLAEERLDEEKAAEERLAGDLGGLEWRPGVVEKLRVHRRYFTSTSPSKSRRAGGEAPAVACRSTGEGGGK